MGIDYAENFKYAEHWRKEVLPYLRHLTKGSVSFGDYLAGYYRQTGLAKTFGAPLPYIYSLEWLKKYKNKCVTFHYNSPEEVQKGAAVMSVIYQISSKLHTSTNISIWREDFQSDGQVTNYVVYENLDDLLQLMEDNLSIIKKPKEKPVGFALGSSPEGMNENPIKL